MDVPVHFVSQYFILVRFSIGFKRRMEYEVAGRARVFLYVKSFNLIKCAKQNKVGLTDNLTYEIFKNTNCITKPNLLYLNTIIAVPFNRTFKHAPGSL